MQVTEMTEMTTDVDSIDRLKHRPMFLVSYRNYDGPYTGNSDCMYLSLGWAQFHEHELLKKLSWSDHGLEREPRLDGADTRFNSSRQARHSP